MSNEVITCFNAVECTYKDCVMYSEEIDMCKLEYLKGKPAAKTSTAPKTVTLKTVEPEAQTTLGGSRLISSLKVGEKSTKDNKINIKGTLKYDAETKEVNTQEGPKDVTSIVIEDDSGEAKVSFWGDFGKEVADFKKGDKLFFEGLYRVKSLYKDIIQIDGGQFYKVAKLN